MELGDVTGSLLEQVRVQHVAEQVVVAVPGAVAVERDQEQVRPVQRLEHRPAAPAAGQPADRVAQRPGEPVEDRGVEQEAAYVVGLAAQDLVGEVVDDEPVVAGEPGDEARTGRRGRAARGRQLEGRDPALGPRLERRDVGVREAEAVEVVEVAGHLVAGEAQVGGADLDQLAPSPQPRQRQRGVGAGADDQPQLWRQVVDEERHPGGDVDTVGEVVVVEDERDLAGVHAQLVHHPGEHGLDRRLPGLQERERRGTGARDGPVEGEQDVGPERRRPGGPARRGTPTRPALVARPGLVLSQPASSVVFPNPAGAETSGDRGLRRAPEQVGQARARHDVAARPGQEQLRLHQRVGHRRSPPGATRDALERRADHHPAHHVW